MTDNPKLKGLGGWLIVVAIFIVFTLVLNLFTIGFIVMTLKFHGSDFINQVSDQYIPNISWILSVEIGLNAILILFAIYLLYLFFTKNYKFPYYMLGYLFTSCSFLLLDQYLCYHYTKLPIESREIAKTVKQLIWSGIWAAYILRSERVVNTFVEGQCKSHNNIIN